MRCGFAGGRIPGETGILSGHETKLLSFFQVVIHVF